MSDSNRMIGLALVVVAIILFFFSLSNLLSAVDTDTGSALENETQEIKNIIGIYGYVILLLPFILFIAGLGLVWRG